jgi:hypothetical protein
MKWMAYYIYGFLAAIFAVTGFVTWIVTAAKVDLTDPKSVKVFKTGFEKDCFGYVADGMKLKGETPDYQEEALIKQVCACDANAVLKILQRQKSVKIGVTVEAKRALKNGTPEMKAAFQSCALAYGLGQ